jgi:hypothetical protein
VRSIRPSPPPRGRTSPAACSCRSSRAWAAARRGYAKGLLPYAGGGVKLSVLRTWGNPLWAEPRATYVGVEADASFFIKLSIGLMRRVGGNRESHDVLVTGGIGLAF